MAVLSCSVVSDSLWPQALLSMGILQARILERVAMPFSRGSPNPGTEPRSLELQADSLPSEPPGKPKNTGVGTYNNSFIITKACKLKPVKGRNSWAKSVCVCCHFSRVWLWDSMDCSPPGSSVHGILQARILEWIAMPSSRESFHQGSNPHLLLAGRFFATSATRDAPSV